MPGYSYKCGKCKHIVKLPLPMGTDPKKRFACQCGYLMKRIITPGASFKGFKVFAGDWVRKTYGYDIGMLTVIHGPMFAGKSTRLVSLARANIIAGRDVVGFKPSNDNRHPGENISTHDEIQFPAFVINKNKPQECFDSIRSAGHKVDVLIFDEAQFFTKEPMEALIKRAVCNWGYDVIVAGLSMDSEGRPFGAMPYLLAVADEIISLKAVCVKCKSINMATRTFRKDGTTEQVAVGGAEMYEPRCFTCWEEGL